jgi:hypothetical protein
MDTQPDAQREDRPGSSLLAPTRFGVTSFATLTAPSPEAPFVRPDPEVLQGEFEQEME